MSNPQTTPTYADKDRACVHTKTSWVECAACDDQGCADCYGVGAVRVCDRCSHVLDRTEYEYLP